MVNVQTVADYFLTLVDEESGDNISHLKLQKLLYYAQGFHLAIHRTRLFDECIEAWAHGPVVRKLYHKYSQYGAGAIPQPEAPDFSSLSDEHKELLDDVFNVYGAFSGWKLRNMTHDEPPWKETPPRRVISDDRMKEYFQTQLCDE